MVPVASGIIKIQRMPSPFQMPSPHQLLVGYHWVFANITSYVTARPIPRKHEAFLNRCRPSSPSVTEENDEIKTNAKEILEEVSTLKSVRARTRVRGSLLRPRPKQNSPQVVDEVIRRRPQRIKTPEEAITTIEYEQRDAPHLADSMQEVKATPSLRVRTRTRINFASVPNTVKGEQSSSRQRNKGQGES